MGEKVIDGSEDGTTIVDFPDGGQARIYEDGSMLFIEADPLSAS